MKETQKRIGIWETKRKNNVGHTLNTVLETSNLSEIGSKHLIWSNREMWFLAPDVNYTIRPDKVEVGLYIEQRGSEGVMCLVLIGPTVVFVWMAEPAEFPPLYQARSRKVTPEGRLKDPEREKERETWNRTKWKMERWRKQLGGEKWLCFCLKMFVDVLYLLSSYITQKCGGVGKSLLQTSVMMYIGYSVNGKLCKNNDSSFGVHSRVILVFVI